MDPLPTEPDGDCPVLPDDDPATVLGAPGVYVTTNGDSEGFCGVTVMVRGLGPSGDCPLEDPVTEPGEPA